MRQLLDHVQAHRSAQRRLGCRWQQPRRHQLVRPIIRDFRVHLLNLCLIGTTESEYNMRKQMLRDSLFFSTATIKTTRVEDVSDICIRYNGNSSGAEPTQVGKGPDGTVRAFRVILRTED